MMVMCISGGLEGLKTENVEKLFVFKAFFKISGKIELFLTGWPGGLGVGKGRG